MLLRSLLAACGQRCRSYCRRRSVDEMSHPSCCVPRSSQTASAVFRTPFSSMSKASLRSSLAADGSAVGSSYNVAWDLWLLRSSLAANGQRWKIVVGHLRTRASVVILAGR